MTRGLLSSMALLAGTGLALAQTPAPMPAGPATAAVASGGQPSAPVAVSLPAQSASPYQSGAGAPMLPNALSPGGAGELMTTASGGCAGCGSSDGCPHGDCNQPYYQAWFNTDYILWRISGTQLPTLVFNQPLGTITVNQIVNNGTGAGNFLISQTLPVLLAANVGVPQENFKDFSGVRSSAGVWLDKDQCWGIDASYFYLFDRNVQFANIPVGSQTNQPFQILIPSGIIDQIAVQGGTAGANSTVIPVPVNLLAGVNSTTVASISDQMWGTELNLRARTCYFGCSTIDWFAGLRYLEFDEDLDSAENLTLTPVTVATVPMGTGTSTTPVGFNGTILDSIHTQNRYYGGQVGTEANVCLGGGVFLDGVAKIGIGDMHEDIELSGVTINRNAAGVITGSMPGGNLVGPGDNGAHRYFDRIAYIPELGLNLGWQPCSWFRVHAGYTFMFISTLARAPDQSTTTSTSANVTLGNVSGGSTGSSTSAAIQAPTFAVHDSNMYIQGINFGIEFRW